MTLEARGFGVSPRRTTLRDLRMRPADWVAPVATFGGATLLVWLALAHGVGRKLV